MPPGRLRLLSQLLVLVAAPSAVAAAAMANYSGQPTGTQIAWVVIAALFTLGGGLAQIVVASLPPGKAAVPVGSSADLQDVLKKWLKKM
jgi:hypothetical protein